MKAYGITRNGTLHDCMTELEDAENLLRSDPLYVEGRNVSHEAIIEELDPIDCTMCLNYIENDGGCPGLLETNGGE